MSLRIIFAGTPEFAVPTLEALVASSHQILGVFTQPDRPAGRGQQLQSPPTKQLALTHNIPVFQPKTLRDTEIQETIKKLNPDVIVVVAYGLILPQAVLTIPRFGCINIHPSLLPRWRGAAPIQRAILAGDAETGITLMQMDAGLDTGAMLSRHPLAIGAEETAGQLHDRLAALGAEAIVALLPRLAEVVGEPQETRLATYAAKIDKAQAHLDWQQPALALLRQVRAYNPVPGAWTLLDGQPFKVWQAETMACAVRAAPPGTVLRADGEGIEVACATGGLRLLGVQAACGKRLSAAAFLAGRAVAAGSVLV